MPKRRDSEERSDALGYNGISLRSIPLYPSAKATNSSRKMCKVILTRSKLGGHAGELYVSAELSKRGIPNALLPENFSDDDILISKKDGYYVGYIQVKACHPDRSSTFILDESAEKWENAGENQFVVFVWLGSPKSNENPKYWIAKKNDVGKACKAHKAHGANNWERRFNPKDLNELWFNNWNIFECYMPTEN